MDRFVRRTPRTLDGPGPSLALGTAASGSGLTNPTTGAVTESTILTKLREALECPVCRATVEYPVLLPKCNHTFCSYCLHTAFESQPARHGRYCPVCRVPARPNDAVPCLSLQAVGHILRTGSKGPVGAQHSSKAVESSSAGAGSAKQASKPMQRMGVLPYNTMSVRALKQYLQGLGMPTDGSRADLEWRHREYAKRHNAALDGGLEPDRKLLRAQVNRTERSRASARVQARAAHREAVRAGSKAAASSA